MFKNVHGFIKKDNKQEGTHRIRSKKIQHELTIDMEKNMEIQALKLWGAEGIPKASLRKT